MTTVSMVEFRRDAEAVIRKAMQGQRMILTYRGKPVLRLEPIENGEPREDDPIYHLDKLVPEDAKGGHLTNEEIDRIVYGI